MVRFSVMTGAGLSTATRVAPRRMMTVANHLLASALVAKLGVLFDPRLDFRLNRLLQQTLRSVPQNLRQNVASRCWNRRRCAATFVHRRTLLPNVGGSEPSQWPEEYAAFFQPAINEIWL